MTDAEGSMSKESARILAREWIDSRIKKPTKAYSRSQMRWLMTQFADRCVGESLRLGKGDDDLKQRLEEAYEIIHGAWYSVTPSDVKNVEYVELEHIDSAGQEKIERARNLLWSRHDVKRAFSEGTLSDQYPDIDKDTLIAAIAEYLERPYLRLPLLDWIFLDMIISREIAAFGESLKQNWLPGKRSFFGISERYIRSNGNLSEMSKIDWKEVGEKLNVLFWWIIGIPVATIWASFHWKLWTLGYWFLGIYALLIAIYIFVLALGAVRWGWRKLRGYTDPKTRVFKLWDEMYEVWRILEGPIVNPTNVREAMVASRAKGAVWDNAAWSLIDRVIANDAAVWVVQPFV